MAISVTYQPDKGISFGDTLLLWGTDRPQARALLNYKFEIDDNIIDISQNNKDGTPQCIIQRRDIYKNYQGQDNFFFLNFDTNERLIEVELHHGLNINIANISIDFSMDINEVASLLDNISGDKRQFSEGEYLFENLKLTIANKDTMGGNGNQLSYFYCSKDITHLTNNEVCA